jgi:hypothetical protein
MAEDKFNLLTIFVGVQEKTTNIKVSGAATTSKTGGTEKPDE